MQFSRTPCVGILSSVEKPISGEIGFEALDGISEHATAFVFRSLTANEIAVCIRHKLNAINFHCG